MKFLGPLTLTTAAASAFVVSSDSRQHPIHGNQDVIAQDQYLIELSPGVTRWVTDEEKWELKRKGQNFMDITATGHTFPHVATTQRIDVEYPSKMYFNTTVKPLVKNLSKDNMRKNLEKFSSFYTRYYRSDTGIESAEWLYGKVKEVIESAGADEYGATVEKFAHEWGQPSIIARIPGKSEKKIVIGAHQDSTNLFLPSFLPAPGADDDGSGTVTILETLRVLLMSDDVVQNNATNTIEFHWYSAEEGGLLGSQAIFESYSRKGYDVRAMLQQDMTGYVKGTFDAGKEESLGIVTDFVYPGLTEYLKEVIVTYCDIPYVLTKCGYGCSDHASATKYGYPSAFAIEAAFELTNHNIHSTSDTIDLLSFDHMLQHAKMTLGMVYELGMASL